MRGTAPDSITSNSWGEIITNVLSRLAFVAALAVLGSVLISGRAAPQTPAPNKDSASSQPAIPHDEKATFKVNVEMVLVRVVVHDRQGRPVDNLRQEDFRLFDNGKEQSITQFEAEVPRDVPLPVESSRRNPSVETTVVEAASVTPKTPVSQPRYLALYFDDFSMSPADMGFTRDAADRYLTKNLRSMDRAAIVTASGAVTVEFTGDLKVLHDALFKLMPSALGKNHDCPEITDYQAEEIIDRESYFLPGPSAGVPPPATELAIDEAITRCHMPSMSPSDLLEFVRSKAQSVLDRSHMLAQYRLEALNRLVNYISLMPGQRNIILASSGFLTTAQQLGATSFIDRALRSQVIISSIDSKGMAVLTREGDASQDYMPTQGNLVGERHQMDTEEQVAAGQFLAEVAESTGGKYFHNNNDLDAGFHEAAVVAEPGYVLAFSPSNLKFDGKFHALKVTLRQKRRGYSMQSRKGYFAPLHASDPGADVKQQIQDALHLRVDLNGLPVTLRTKTESSATGWKLLVWAHLDIHELQFRKDGDANVNSLMFVSAIFSHEGNFVSIQQKELQLNLPADSLRQLLASGIDVTLTFPLKPGSYLVREVVTDSEKQSLTALSRDVEVP
jgi:VWFA-related protein